MSWFTLLVSKRNQYFTVILPYWYLNFYRAVLACYDPSQGFRLFGPLVLVTVWFWMKSVIAMAACVGAGA